MKHSVHAVCQKISWVILLAIGWVGRPLLAQPTVSSLAPARSTTIARNGTVSVEFSTAVQASSATALRVFGTQRGGSKAGVAAVSGNQLTFKPNREFLAGEKLWLTLDRHGVHSLDQGELARAQVWQLTAAATGGTGQLTPGALLDWAADPSLLTTGDVNGDGYPDVLAIYTTNGDYSSTLSIRLNDGTGSYAAIADQKIPYYVSALALGDLDADGDLDLMAVGTPLQGSGYYSILLNQGAGVFNTSTQVSLLGYTPQNSLELADMDADGSLDIIMPMKYGSTNALVVRFNKNGSFPNNATVLLSGTIGSEAAVGDLDGDGDLDILTADASGKLVVSLNSGSGTFTSNGPTINTIAGYSQKLYLADLDGDGDLDALLASNLPQVSSVLVRLNNGRAGFSAGPTITLPVATPDLTLADLDGDGDQDLLYCYGQHVASQLNTGRATFEAGTDVVLDPTLRRLAVSDADGDGDLDVLASGHDYQVARNQVVVLRNGPAAPAAYAVTAVAPAAGRSAARTALVAATFSTPLGSASTAGLRVLSSLGQGQVAGPVAVAGNTLTLTPAVAYLPGELVSATATKAVRSATGVPLARPYVWQFTAAVTGGNAQFGGGVRVQFSTLSNYPLAMRLADIDGDGDLDIITSFNASNNTNYDLSQPLLLNVQRNNGRGSFAAPAPLLGPGIAGVGFALADVDSDGDLDYLGGASGYDPATGSSTYLGSVWLNDGRGTFAARGTINNAQLGIYGSSFAWGVGDLDGDGDPDLMNGGVRLNDGQGNFYGGGALANVDYVRGSVLADLDNDGDLDCITSTDAARDYFVHLNDGAGALTQGVRVGTGSFGEDLLVRDIDGDGDVDVIAAASGFAYTNLWLNDGQAKFSRGTGVAGYPQAVGDLDGDGDYDLVTTAGCFLNNGSGAFGAARSPTLATQDVRSALGDLDGDGDLDYVGVSDGYQGWTIRFNAGQALATTAPSQAAGSAWPNPVAAGGRLTCSLPAPGAATLTLRTLLGQLVWQQPVSGASPTVPVGSVLPGVYLLTWVGAGQPPVTQRLTVE